MLHSFWYVAAEKTFTEVISEDPSCGVATWPRLDPHEQPARRAWVHGAAGAKAMAAIEAGRVMGTKTERERDYIEAVAAYYDDWANKPERARQLARAEAYQKLAAKYPKDDEAQIFAALYTAATQQLSDQTYSAYLKAAAVLEEQFKKYPDHPGVAHYLIHSYDAAPIAEKGVKAARLYATIAPDAPHALHMPSHIFTRVGAWEDSAATNRSAKSKAAARAMRRTTRPTTWCMPTCNSAATRHAASCRRRTPSRRQHQRNPRALCDRRHERPDGSGAQRLAGGRAAADAAAEHVGCHAGQHFAPRWARRVPATSAWRARSPLAEIQRTRGQEGQILGHRGRVQRLIVAGWIARGRTTTTPCGSCAAADLEDRNEAHRDAGPARAGARGAGRAAARAGPAEGGPAEFETSRNREPIAFAATTCPRSPRGAGDRPRRATTSSPRSARRPTRTARSSCARRRPRDAAPRRS